ncbi:MAG TPA: CehA/McbA family metallohydrolase [Chthonomonadales bacterium]|nr:CehA/McbA family metallohydrolase [Chthonomonadales bacterium]
MHRLPFEKPGEFRRGNLHTHSTISDGHLTPEQACRYYHAAGYDFLALTDHFLRQYEFQIADTRPLRTADFTTIIGAELHTGETELGNLWHILAVGLPLDFAAYPSGETGPQVAQRAADAGAFVAVAHPNWYGLTGADCASLAAAHAVEIFNGTAADHNDKADSAYMLDMLLARGLRRDACATDDAHFTPARADTLRGWVQVKSKSLHPDALVEALRAGLYYSSTGPQIHDIRISPGPVMRVQCSAVDRIFVTGAGSNVKSESGFGIIRAEIELKPFERDGFCRVTLRDSAGRRAWSNPIWL